MTIIDSILSNQRKGGETGLSNIYYKTAYVVGKYNLPKVNIKRDSNLIAYENGVVYDIRTGLEWLAGPVMKWDNAKSWVKNCTVDGGGWRMPSPYRLKSIYRPGTSTIPLLEINGCCVWSNEENATESGFSGCMFASYVTAFDYGEGRFYYPPSFKGYSVLAVRSHMEPSSKNVASLQNKLWGGYLIQFAPLILISVIIIIFLKKAKKQISPIFCGIGGLMGIIYGFNNIDPVLWAMWPGLIPIRPVIAIVKLLFYGLIGLGTGDWCSVRIYH